MSNTVLIKGKGMAVGLTLYRLREWLKQGNLTSTMKWWQTEVRHELRLQNLAADEIHNLKLHLPQSSFNIEIF